MIPVERADWLVMRWLIDGYNVMHAGGRLGPKLSRTGFRNARRRFLDEISAALGPDEARQTTVVFDASVHPGDFALNATYRGLGILFALGDESADARIEEIIADHTNARTLTVVSSDRRIRRAAARRRAKVLTADQFWERIDDLKEREGLNGRPGKPNVSEERDGASQSMRPSRLIGLRRSATWPTHRLPGRHSRPMTRS